MVEWIADNPGVLCLVVLVVIVMVAFYANSRGLSGKEIKRRRKGDK